MNAGGGSVPGVSSVTWNRVGKAKWNSVASCRLVVQIVSNGGGWNLSREMDAAGLSMDGEKNQGVIIVRVCTIHSL